ncbi:hypothetical protein [Devosia sp.]|nr:hypothetical protein [Devosia sp.]
MSLLTRLLGWLRLSAPSRHTPHPDCLSLREWADLPTHHPRCS